MTGELEALLVRAARMAAAESVDHDDFLRGAFAAYVDAVPGFRELLEQHQMLAQLAALRERGAVGQA